MALTTVARRTRLRLEPCHRARRGDGHRLQLHPDDVPGQRRRHLYRQPRQREQFRHAGQPRQARRPRRRGAARRVLPATAKETASRSGRSASPSTTTASVYCSDEWTNTISVFDTNGKFIRKWGKTGSGDGELLRPAGLAVEKNGNVIVVDSGNNRLQVFTPGRQVCRQMRQGRQRTTGEFNQPWGITLDKDGNIYVADWKNHRVQKLSPQGKSLMCDRQLRQAAASPRTAYAVTYLGPFISSARAKRPVIRRPVMLNHPTDVAVDHRRRHLCHRLGQSPGLHLRSRRRAAHQPDRRRAGVVEVGPAEHRRQPRHDEGAPPGEEPGAALALLLPDGGGFRSRRPIEIIVADSQRNRLQVYKKVRDYPDFQANL